MNAIIQSLRAVETTTEMADRLLAPFTSNPDQELGRIYVVGRGNRQIFMRDCTAITEYDQRIRIHRRNIIRWLGKGYRLVLVACRVQEVERGDHVAAGFGVMVDKNTALDILSEEGCLDAAGFNEECWNLYNTGDSQRGGWGLTPKIEASRIFEWLGF